MTSRGLLQFCARFQRGIIIAGLLLLMSATARADYAVLASGHRLEITAHEVNGALVRLYLASGGYADVPRVLVVGYEIEEKIEPLPAAVGEELYREVIRAAAAQHAISPALVRSVIAVESNFNPRAVSRKGAQGLMQLMPATASRFAVRNAFDPTENLRAGIAYLKELLAQFRNNWPLALAAYNAGPERVTQYGGIPPYPETRQYVRKVMEKVRRTQVNLTPR